MNEIAFRLIRPLTIDHLTCKEQSGLKDNRDRVQAINSRLIEQEGQS